MKQEKSNPHKFFAPIKELMLEFAEKGEGKVVVNLISHPTGNGHSELKVSGDNLADRLNSISSKDLRNYLSELQSPKDGKAIKIFQQSLLDILDESGFGQVKLNFSQNKREETIIFYEVTISRKVVLQSDINKFNSC